jgi:hypothetical protein
MSDEQTARIFPFQVLTLSVSQLTWVVPFDDGRADFVRDLDDE